MYYVEAITDGETFLLHDLDPSSNVKLQSGKIHPALNAISDFTFTLLQNHPQFGKLKPFKTLLRVTDEKGNIFWRGRVLDPTAKMSSNGLMYIDYTAEDELSFLLDSKQRHGEFHDITPKQYLQIILDNHNQSVAGDMIDKTILLGNVNVTNSTNNVYRYLSYDTSLSNILEDLVSSLGGYLSLRYEGGKRYLDYLTDSGTTSPMSIALADNLKSIESQQNPSEIITRLIPLGAYLEDESGASKPRLTIKSVNDNKDYIDDPELVAQYGIVEGFVIWDDVTQPSNLKAKGQAWLSKQRLTDSVTITAADLSLIDESYESFKLGNFYRAENKELGIDRLYRLSAQEIDILNPLESTLEFGDRKTSLTSYSGGFVGQKELAENTSQTLQKARDNATELINAATTGYVVVRPHEILIMDTDEIATAQNVWRWNQNGLGHSKNGYNGPYNLAMTKDGQIVADRITVGTLLADLIKAGVLKSANGKTEINMDSGIAKLYGSLTTVAENGFETSVYGKGIVLNLNGVRKGYFWGNENFSWLNCDRVETGDVYLNNIISRGESNQYAFKNNGKGLQMGNVWLNDNVRFIAYTSGAGGIMSDTHEVGLYAPKTRVSGGGTRFDTDADKFVFFSSGLKLVDCYNNLDMHNYSILNQSDARLKTDIKPTDVNGLDIINAIDLQKFRWIENGEYEDIGIIAQQLQEIAPDLVHTNPADGHLSVKTLNLLYYLIKAVQELSGKKESKPLNLKLDPRQKWRYTRNLAKLAKPKETQEQEENNDETTDNT